jgi:hypothetical protein
MCHTCISCLTCLTCLTRLICLPCLKCQIKYYFLFHFSRRPRIWILQEAGEEQAQHLEEAAQAQVQGRQS